VVRGGVEPPTSAFQYCAVKCRIVRGLFVGDVSADPDLWGFCGDAAVQEAVVLDRCPASYEHPPATTMR
jgi:hypothetical protein